MFDSDLPDCIPNDEGLTAAPGTGTPSVATYNIHKFVGRDGRRDPERTFAVLRELDADVIGIQEFDSRKPRRGEAVSVADLERETGYAAHVHPTRHHRGGYHGNLLLTRHDARDVYRHDIGASELEPRGMMVADFDVEGRTLRVAVTHLALWPPARVRQAARLVRQLRAPGNGPMILMGDLNEWLPMGGARDVFAQEYGAHPTPATFPSIRPLLGFDQMWATPRGSLFALDVHRSKLADRASDHLPVKAAVNLFADAA